jgi:S-adenosyl-L-methionine hydrolase (adenosine-forming)
MRYSTISFLSDYGLEDEFVGVVHSVVRSIAPDVAVIDVTHAIEPHDVRGGGLALARSAQYLCPGVVLAVVDPGVGSNRRPVAIEVGDGASILVGPDNGLLAPAVAMVGGATAAVELTNSDYHLPAPGPTFAGRDIFAPVAANLCLGVPLSELGRTLDPGELVPGVLPISRVEGDALVAEVLWVDRFGNLQLNVDPGDIESYGPRVRLRFAGRRPACAPPFRRSRAHRGAGAVLSRHRRGPDRPRRRFVRPRVDRGRPGLRGCRAGHPCRCRGVAGSRDRRRDRRRAPAESDADRHHAAREVLTMATTEVVR